MAKKVGNTYFFTGKGKSSGGGGGGGDATDAIKYTEQTLAESQQMQARKNQGLYYSEGTPAGVVTWDGNTSGLEYLDIDGNPEHYMYKVADSPTNIVGENFLSMTNSSGTEIAIAGNDDIQVNEMGSSYKELIPDIEVTGSAWVTASEVANSGGIIVSTGLILHNPASPDTDIVFPAGIYFSPNLRAFNYSAVEEVHQIPAKYIPNTGLEYYEIEATTLNPQQLNSVELTGYNYQDIVDALEAGKILVLTLRYDYGGENPVYGKYIGGQPSRMYNPDNDYGMACVRFPAAYSYLDQTITGHFNAAVVKDIVIYEDWSQGGDEPILMLGVEDVTIV